MPTFDDQEELLVKNTNNGGMKLGYEFGNSASPIIRADVDYTFDIGTFNTRTQK